MFKLVNDIKEANCITHGAKFHADDIFIHFNPSSSFSTNKAYHKILLYSIYYAEFRSFLKMDFTKKNYLVLYVYIPQ